MFANVAHSLTIDLNQFKLHLHLDSKTELTLHFDSPSRRFYLSIIGLVVQAIKKEERIFSVSLEKNLDILVLLNETVGAAAGSSDKEHLLPRIYRKWKDALPDLENAPLFKVIGRKKRYSESADRVYAFSEAVKDDWANLFEYRGSHMNVRLRFSIDKVGLDLDDVIIIYGNEAATQDEDPWERFIAHLLESREVPSQSKAEAKTDGGIRPVTRIDSYRPHLRIRRQPWVIAVVGVVFFIVLVIPIIRNAWRGTFEIPPASVEKMTFPLPQQPSIAVLPFQNLSGDPQQDYFCDGLTQDIITGLSKVSALFVIAPHSSMSYKGKQVDQRQVSEELGVRYLLEGSVRRCEDQIRISVQLFDMIDGKTLWADRYDRQLRDIFEIQDQITINILSALRYKLTGMERDRVLRKTTQNLQAYLKVLEGSGCLYLFKIDEGLKCFDKAISHDPGFAEAYAWKSFAHMRSCWFGPRSDRVDHFVKAVESARRCKQLDKGLAACNMAMGLTHLVNNDFLEAIREEQMAVERWPSSADAAAFLAIAFRAVGKYQEALKEIERALRLNPIRPVYALQILGIVQFDMRRYDEAIATCKKVLKISPLQLPANMVLALAYKQQGREADARSAAEDILRIRPNFTARDYTMLFPKKTVKDIDTILNGLLDDVKNLK
jgi:adenylate cyclase